MKVVRCSDQSYSRICQAAADNGTYLADALDQLVFDVVQPVFRWREGILASNTSIGQDLISEMRKQGIQVAVGGEEPQRDEVTPARPHNDSIW